MCVYKCLEELAYSQVHGDYKDKHRPTDTNMQNTCVYLYV